MKKMLIKVYIAGLTLDPVSKSPMVILRSMEGEYTLSLWVGALEISSIASVLQKMDYDRPMTHDLFKNFMTKVEAKITSVEINDIVDNTYFGRIHFNSGGKNLSIDARPSDAIALAMRFDAPIYIEKHVLEDAGDVNFKSEVMDKSEHGKKWAEYLEKLTMDDFGKYII